MDHRNTAYWYQNLFLQIITLMPYSIDSFSTTTSSFTSPTGIDYQLGMWHNLEKAVNCNFTHDICFWRQTSQDTFDWILSSGSTSSTGTGPSTDHSGSGNYIYTESSSPRRLGDAAILESYTLHPRNNQHMCFTFWYHMYGSSMGTLDVFLKRGNGTSASLKKIWTASGGMNSKWHLGEVNIDPPGPLNIQIKGIIGSSYTSDMAIDDLALHVNRCQLTDPKAIVG